MKYLKQLFVILLFCLLGELCSLLPLPIPAAVYGLIFLFIALLCGIVKVDSIRETANFLLQIMPLLFVAPAVSILSHWGLIAPNFAAILIITLVTTLLVFAVSSLVTHVLLPRKKEASHHE